MYFENCTALFTGQTRYDAFSVTFYCHINLAWLRNAGSIDLHKGKTRLSLVSGRHHRAYFKLRQANMQMPHCWPEVFPECIKAINYSFVNNTHFKRFSLTLMLRHLISSPSRSILFTTYYQLHTSYLALAQHYQACFLPLKFNQGSQTSPVLTNSLWID